MECFRQAAQRPDGLVEDRGNPAVHRDHRAWLLVLTYGLIAGIGLGDRLHRADRWTSQWGFRSRGVRSWARIEILNDDRRGCDVSRPPKWVLAGAWGRISLAWGSSGPRHRPHPGRSGAHEGVRSVRGGGLAGIRKSDRTQLHKLTGLGGWLTAECGFDAARRLVRVIEAQAAVASRDR
jgi:hypothetical protein